MSFWENSKESLEDRKEKALKEIDPNYTSEGSYWSIHCPKCKRKRAFLYKAGWQIKCNRRTHCGYEESIWDYMKQDNEFDLASWKEERREERRKQREERKKQQRRDENHAAKTITPALGHQDYELVTFLNCRIPDNKEGVESLFKRKIVGLSKEMNENTQLHKWLDRKNYKMLSPLYNIKTGKIISAQARFSIYGETPTILSKKGKPLKTMSLSGYRYGECGATFGNIHEAIKTALKNSNKKNRPRIVVVEGDIDYATARACKHDNVVGVPGCDQALNVVRYIQNEYDEFDVVLCLDGDDAGEESFEAVAKIVIKEGIHLFNARPMEMDLNDAYRNWGGIGAVNNLFINAKRYIKEQEEKKKKFIAKDPDLIQMWRNGLFIKPEKMMAFSKDRYKAIIDGSGRSRSPIKSLARTILCGEVRETELLYKHKEDPNPELGATRARVSECPGCSHCLANQWNFFLCDFIQKNWPEDLHYCSVKFDKGDIEDALRKKKEICQWTRAKREYSSDRETSRSFFLIIDVIKSRIIVVSGAKDKNDMALSTMRALAHVEEIKRTKFLKEHLIPAYMSYANYVIYKGQIFSHDPTTDLTITKKYKRYMCREGLPFPAQKTIRDGVRAYVAKRRSEEKEEEPVVPEGFGVKFTYRARAGILKKIIGISWDSINFGNILKSDMFKQKMNFDPRDPRAGNFLERPELAPKPPLELINDFHWKLFCSPAYVGTEEVTEVPLELSIAIKTEPKKEKKYYADKDEELIDIFFQWEEAGYNPSRHNFTPQSKKCPYTLDEFKEAIAREKLGFPFPKEHLVSERKSILEKLQEEFSLKEGPPFDDDVPF